jgi:hypothetical protein
MSTSYWRVDFDIYRILVHTLHIIYPYKPDTIFTDFNTFVSVSSSNQAFL